MPSVLRFRRIIVWNNCAYLCLTWSAALSTEELNLIHLSERARLGQMGACASDKANLYAYTITMAHEEALVLTKEWDPRIFPIFFRMNLF